MSTEEAAPTQPAASSNDLDKEPYNDDEISTQMTASYSEISFKSEASLDIEIPDVLMLETCAIPIPDKTNKIRPMTLNYEASSLKSYCPLSDEGTVHRVGDMTHFVAEDVEYKIKLSSPQSKKLDTPSRSVVTPKVGQVDARLLSDLECEAHCLATSIDNLTENLCGILHSISSITADNVDVYKNAVSKMSNAMDANIKSMYTMMAKAEEVSQTMKSVQVHHARIKEIKRIVDLFESYI